MDKILDKNNNNKSLNEEISLNQNNIINLESDNENKIPQDNEALNNFFNPEINLGEKNYKNVLIFENNLQTNITTSVTSINEFPHPEINNIVSTASLSCNLNLNSIASKLKNITYNPKKNSGAIYSLKEPKATCLIFSNGQIVCLGTRTEEDSETAIRKIAKKIKYFGYNVNFSNFKIQNIVGSFDFKSPLNIEELYQKSRNNHNVNYEPEIFPGLIYRMKRPKITLLIFNSGKVVLTGGKKIEEIFKAFYRIRSILRNFKII